MTVYPDQRNNLRRPALSISPPRLPRRLRPGATRIVILVIILVFVVVMAALGYAPALALGVASGAVAIAYNPRAVRAVLGALAQG
jgi:hypothetical protein